MLQAMKCVLFSMQPTWVEKVFSGKKDDEIRKLAPDLTPPFKAYVYCTKDGYNGRFPRKEILAVNDQVCNGMVVGEFICTNVVETGCSNVQLLAANSRSRTCVSDEELRAYAAGANKLSFIHIGDRHAYSQPLNIARFNYWEPRVREDEWEEDMYTLQYQIERAPQSWCYVQELSAPVKNEEHGHICWVRPAVQCGECMYRCKGPADGMCFMKNRLVDKDGWCLQGERRAV